MLQLSECFSDCSLGCSLACIRRTRAACSSDSKCSSASSRRREDSTPTRTGTELASPSFFPGVSPVGRRKASGLYLSLAFYLSIVSNYFKTDNMASTDSADDSLYPIAVLIDELRNDDVQVSWEMVP